VSPLFPIDERLSARRTAIATTPCRRSGDRRSARIPSISPAERSRCWAARWARSLYLSLAAEDRAEQRLGAVRSGCCAGASEGPLLLQSTETRKVGLSLLALCLRACAAYRCGREKRASVAMNSSRVAKSQCSEPNVSNADCVASCRLEDALDLGRDAHVEQQRHAAGATTASSRPCAAAAAYSWPNSAERSRAMASFLRYYNRRRPHSSLGDRPPISRVHNVRG
jgi:transposase InsO family protein